MITPLQFSQKVLQFEKQHGPLKNWLNENHIKLVETFLQDPIIQGYLSRPDDVVNFAGGHPIIAGEGSEELAAQYELLIYSSLPKLIPYRNQNLNSSKFSTQKTDEYIDSFIALLKAQAKAYKQIEIGEISNITEISNHTVIHRLKQKITFPYFVLDMHQSEEGHPTPCVTVFDPISRHALVTVIVGFGEQEESFDDLETLFKSPQEHLCAASQVSLKNNIKHYINHLFKIDFDELNLSDKPQQLINKADKSALITHYSDAIESSQQYQELINNKEVDTIFCSMVSNQPWDFLIRHNPRSTRLINASHQLKIGNKNELAFVGYNFMKSIVTLLSDESMCNYILKCARDAYKGDEKAVLALVELFQKRIKTNLTCYYNMSGKAYSPIAIEGSHIKLRWNIGGEVLRLNYPLVSSLSSSSSSSQTISSAFSIAAPKSTPANAKTEHKGKGQVSPLVAKSLYKQSSYQSTDSAEPRASTDEPKSSVSSSKSEKSKSSYCICS